MREGFLSLVGFAPIIPSNDQKETTVTYNWNHKCDHAFGMSHVADRDPRNERIMQQPIRKAFSSADFAHREEIADHNSRNPYLLTNRHA